jgi:hypothetical protein
VSAAGQAADHVRPHPTQSDHAQLHWIPSIGVLD